MQEKIENRDNLRYNLIKKLGGKSNTYIRSLELLKESWRKKDSQIKRLFSTWKNVQVQLYGEIEPNMFFTHTYLTWLMRVIRNEIFGIPIRRDSHDDVFSWRWRIPDIASQFIQSLKSEDKNLHFESINKDLFKDLYEDLVHKGLRVRRGEYNTPDWLAELMLKRVLGDYRALALPRLIDPACGTGTFIFHAIRQLRKKIDFTEKDKIVGIDIHPLMVEIAKTNYLLALGKDQQLFDDDSNIPIFCFDTLKLPNKISEKLRKFDIVIGNPPWGSLRDIKNPDYQKFIKKMALDARLIEKKDTHLYTQIEVSTVFFIKCIELLREGGTLAFIMPRSIIGLTMQNYPFLRAQRLGFRFVEILDLENVEPLFNMPTCVVISKKNGQQTYPIKMIKYHAELSGLSPTLTEIGSLLTFKEAKYTPAFYMSGEKSYYYNLFKTGISIFPRTFYFITPVHIRKNAIEIKTSDEILAKYSKNPWKISLNGWVESEFIYCTVLGWEILPYFYKSLRLVVLPLEKKAGVDKLWCERRTPSSEKRFPSIFDRGNYGNLLDHQAQTRRLVVLYNATGRDLAACIVDRQNLPSVNDIKPSGFIADVKTWTYETNNLDEALYLCGVLNSPLINKMIKPLQPRGLGGARAIHRRPLMLNIPKFDENNQIHREIAELSSLNLEVANQIKISRSRKKIKRQLAYNGEIDSLVKKLLEEK